jgi:hypothetical protein
MATFHKRVLKKEESLNKFWPSWRSNAVRHLRMWKPDVMQRNISLFSLKSDHNFEMCTLLYALPEQNLGKLKKKHCKLNLPFLWSSQKRNTSYMTVQRNEEKNGCALILFYNYCTRWFKYDRDKLWLLYTQIVPVIFEPPCIYGPCKHYKLDLRFSIFFFWRRSRLEYDAKLIANWLPKFRRSSI